MVLVSIDLENPYYGLLILDINQRLCYCGVHSKKVGKLMM
jgi:hypothetical protein